MIHICLVDSDSENAASVRKALDGYFSKFGFKYEADIIDSAALTAPEAWRERGYDLAVFNISDSRDRNLLMEYSVEVRELCRKMKVIFISDELLSVLDIFEYDPDYFIHKPQLNERLATATEHLLKLSANNNANRLVLNTRREKHLITHSSVLYIEHCQHKSKLVCEDKEVICNEKLSTLLERLDDPLFVRCHCSFVANMEHVRKFTRKQLLMSNGEVLPCSRSRRQIVREAFEISRNIESISES